MHTHRHTDDNERCTLWMTYIEITDDQSTIKKYNIWKIKIKILCERLRMIWDHHRGRLPSGLHGGILPVEKCRGIHAYNYEISQTKSHSWINGKKTTRLGEKELWTQHNNNIFTPNDDFHHLRIQATKLRLRIYETFALYWVLSSVELDLNLNSHLYDSLV